MWKAKGRTARDLPKQRGAKKKDVEGEDCKPQQSLPIQASEPDFPRTIMPVEDVQTCRQHKISGVVHLLNDRAELSCGRSWSRNYGPHSSIFRKVDGKPFVSSVLRLSRSERHAFGPI